MSKLLKLLRWVTAAGTLCLLALLAWQCVDICTKGISPENLDVNGVRIQSIFRMDDVVNRLSGLVIPFAVYCAVTAFTILLHTVYGANSVKAASHPHTTEKPEPYGSRKQNIIRVAVFALAVLFILLGVMNGGWYDVLVKAINICTECIGLG